MISDPPAPTKSAAAPDSPDRADVEPDIGGRNGGGRLRGNIGWITLLFSVMAFNAPLGTVVGFTPVAIGLGNGAGLPLFYILGGLIMAIFASGFLKMSHHIKNSGGFYSYITVGLGQEVGLGASFLALVGYAMQLLGSIFFGGISLNLLVSSLGGPQLPWWLYALASILIVGVLGYFKLDLSARVLTVLLFAEVLAVLIYDAVVIARGGAEGLDARAPFEPAHLLSGSFGFGLLIAVIAMGGFEATVVFREEVRDPDRTIRRATYGFLIGIATLYAFTAWCIVQSVGTQHVMEYLAPDPPGGMMRTVSDYLGLVGSDLVTVLLNTSILAASLSLHNVSTRYVYNLSHDGILPRRLATVHAKHGSPHAASVAISVALLLGLIACLVLKGDPNFLYAQLIGSFGYVFLILLLFASVAIGVFMTKMKPADTTVWHRTIAPAAAFVCICVVMYFATTNLDVLYSGGSVVAYSFIAGMWCLVLLGIVTARFLKRRRPDVYARIGRQ